jgi:hypothetical protein
VDYSQANPFVYVPKGFFPNVKTLIIQRLATESNNNREDPFLMIFADKVNTLIRSLPNVHTMELTSIEGAELCHIPTYVEEIIIRSELATMGEPLPMKDFTLLAQINAIAWGRRLLNMLPSDSALLSISMYWPEKKGVASGCDEYEELAARTGVKLATWHNGKIWRMLG